MGENNEGLLSGFPIDGSPVPAELKGFAERYQQAEFKNIVREINDARRVIMRRIIETNETFTRENLPEVRRIFAALNRDTALSGERIQDEDGSWIIK